MNIKKIECVNTSDAVTIVTMLMKIRIKCIRVGTAVVFKVGEKYCDKVITTLRQRTHNINFTTPSDWDVEQLKLRG